MKVPRGFLIAYFLLSCYTFLVIHVIWPSSIPTKAEVWRILDLSGMSKSPRDSMNLVRAGCVFLNGGLVGLGTRVQVGDTFTLEIRIPNKVPRKQLIFLVLAPNNTSSNLRRG